MNRENEWKVFAALITDRIADKPRDELVTNLRDNLPAARDHYAFARARQHQQADQGDGDHHHQRRIGKGDIVAGNLDRDQFLDLELFEWAVFLAAVCISSQRLFPVSIRLCVCGRPFFRGLVSDRAALVLDDPIDIKHSRRRS